MFDDIYPESATRIGQECKPDPEEMLQQMRKRKEKITEDIAVFKRMEGYSLSRSAAYELLGSMYVAYDEALKREQYWLDEIDKD